MTRGFIICDRDPRDPERETANSSHHWFPGAYGKEWVHETIPDTSEWPDRPRFFVPAVAFGGETIIVGEPVPWPVEW